MLLIRQRGGRRGGTDSIPSGWRCKYMLGKKLGNDVEYI